MMQVCPQLYMSTQDTQATTTHGNSYLGKTRHSADLMGIPLRISSVVTSGTSVSSLVNVSQRQDTDKVLALHHGLARKSMRL